MSDSTVQNVEPKNKVIGKAKRDIKAGEFITVKIFPTYFYSTDIKLTRSGKDFFENKIKLLK